MTDNIAAVIEAVRQFHNLKQKEMAVILSISKSYMCELESGQKQPTLEILAKIAQIVGIPTSSLLFVAEQFNQPLVGIDLLRKRRNIAPKIKAIVAFTNANRLA